MKNLSTIHEELGNVISQLNLTGSTIDIIEKLLAEAIYRNEITSVVTLLEGSASRCRNTNSAIQHALDLGYSVPRGRCARVVLRDMIPVQTFSVKKFDDAGTVDAYHLYYAEDYDFRSNVLQDSIEYIVAKNVNSITRRTDQRHIYIDFIPDTGTISTDYLLYDNNDLETPLNTTESPRTFFSNAAYPYLLQTFVDYAVRVYKYSTTSGSFGFPNDVAHKFTLKYVVYDPAESFKYSNIRKMPRFITDTTYPVVDSFTPSTPPLSDPASIHMYSLSAFQSNQIIKSNTDIANLVSSYFYGIIANMNVSYSADGSTINIYYTTYSGRQLSPSQISKFKEEVAIGYNIQGSIVFSEAVPNSDTEPYYMRIRYNTQVSSASVQDVIDKVKYSIGGEFNPYQLLSDIKTEIPGIKLIEYTSADGKSLKSNMKVIKLADNEYYDINVILDIGPYIS